MIWWILGGLAAVYFVSKSDSDSNGGVKLLGVIPRGMGDSLQKALELDRLYGRNPTVEKFMDPSFRAWNWHTDPKPYTYADQRDPGLDLYLWRRGPTWAKERNSGSQQLPILPSVVTEYAYLGDVPRNAEARIAAIRAKVRKVPATGNSLLSQALLDKSAASLRSMADSLVTAYEMVAASTTKAVDVAKSLGVDTRMIESEAQSIYAYAKKTTDAEAVVDKAVKEYGPIAKKAVAEISRVIQMGTSGASTEDKLLTGVDIAANLIMLVPVYGWIIGGAMKVISAIVKADLDEDQANEVARQEAISAAMQRCFQEGVYAPWRVTDGYGYNVKRKDGGDTNNIITCFDETTKFIQELPPGLRPHLKRWWGTAVTYMNDPRVRDVMYSLCLDPAGGTLASDEQVLVVAAPIAVSLGLDIDDLATELWKVSHGWNGADLSALKTDSTQHKYIDPNFIPDDWDGNRQYSLHADRTPNYDVYERVPRNTWMLQLAVLAEDCFRIAEKWRKDGPPAKPAKLVAINFSNIDLSKLKIRGISRSS